MVIDLKAASQYIQCIGQLLLLMAADSYLIMKIYDQLSMFMRLSTP